MGVGLGWEGIQLNQPGVLSGLNRTQGNGVSNGGGVLGARSGLGSQLGQQAAWLSSSWSPAAQPGLRFGVTAWGWGHHNWGNNGEWAQNNRHGRSQQQPETNNNKGRQYPPASHLGCSSHAWGTNQPNHHTASTTHPPTTSTNKLAFGEWPWESNWVFFSSNKQAGNQ